MAQGALGVMIAESVSNAEAPGESNSARNHRFGIHRNFRKFSKIFENLKFSKNFLKFSKIFENFRLKIRQFSKFSKIFEK